VVGPRVMKRVLIVSPHFPPINAPDMHRVRMSLPHYRENGWTPFVLTVKPEAQDMPVDASLSDFIPDDVTVHHTGALPLGLTRPFGVGNAGLRALAPLYFAGARMIRANHIDVVFFSTTMFVVTVLGRLWKRRLGVPYVVDMQDPWYTTYYDDRPRDDRPPKHAAAQQMNRRLERWTMKGVDQLIAVSPGYLSTLRERYPWIRQGQCTTIPFGASERDFDVALAKGGTPAADPWRGVYVGAGGTIMSTAARILFRALASGRARGERFRRVTLEFTGTSYAPAAQARPSLAPIAAAEAVGDRVQESTDRIGYQAALRALRSAGFLVLIGSDDPDYNASKVFTYLLAQRPLIAIVHEASPMAELLRRSRANVVVTFASREDIEGPAARLEAEWAALLETLPDAPAPSLEAVQPYLAPVLTRAQCAVLSAAQRPTSVAREVACPE